MTSVSVFIDYENTRFGAREVFGDPQRDPYTFARVRDDTDYTASP